MTTDTGRIHYRCMGSGPAIVMLHDSPRSSRLHVETIRRLATHFTVYALDTPGYGNSAPLGIVRPVIADFAVALGAAIKALGLEQAPIYATHTSAKIALEYGAYYARPPLLILDGVAIPEAAPELAFIKSYMRPFQLDDSGAYLASEWTRARDMVRWFPWFDTRPETRIAMPAPTDAWMAAYMIDLLSAGPYYSDAYTAAMYYDPSPTLRSIRVRTLVIARADDVLFEHLDRVPTAANPALTVQRIKDDREQWLASLRTAFAGASTDRLPERRGGAAAPVDHGPAYVAVPHGQIHVNRRGKGRPLLILEAPTTLHALKWQRHLYDDRLVLVPEMPGFGESDPIGTSELAAYADAFSAMLETLGLDAVDVLALGYATPLGAALAARHPGKVARLILDGSFVGGHAMSDHEQEALCPEIVAEAGGGHLHRIWHMLRDGEAQWPWFNGDIAARRDLVPLFDAQKLHHALLGILKQPVHYGDVALAAARADAMAIYRAVRCPCLIFERATDPGYRAVDLISSAMVNTRRLERPATIEAAAAILREALAISPSTVACMEASL